MEVHNTLGPGFLEGVYQDALEIELTRRGIQFSAQPELEISYKGAALRHKYKPDFRVEEKVIVEIKASIQLTDVDMAQAINYLKTGFKVALLINFGARSLEWRRVVL